MAALAGVVWGALERGLGGGQWLGYQWENPELVPLEKFEAMQEKAKRLQQTIYDLKRGLPEPEENDEGDPD